MVGQQSGVRKFAKRISPALAGMIIAMATVQQASALSCMSADIKASFKKWSSSDSHFIIVRGMLKPLGTLPKPKTALEIQNGQLKNLEAVQYHFTGINIQDEGNVDFEANVLVEPKCLGPWCGPYPNPSGMVITALERQEGGKYFLRPNPCPGDFFTGNMAELEQTIRNCIKGQACTPDMRPNKIAPGSSTTIKIQ